MKLSLKKGASYGTTSGVITTLGLLIGLYSGTNSKATMIAGVLTIAFADALSDGLGMHISEESENHHSAKEIWETTIATIVSKMILGLSFILPIVLFPLSAGIIINILWGVFVLSALSWKIAKANSEKLQSVLIEHLAIAVIVVLGSYYIGLLINKFFSA